LWESDRHTLEQPIPDREKMDDRKMGGISGKKIEQPKTGD